MKCRIFPLTQNAARAVCVKHPKGFTLIELVVACTLLIILSTIATTTADNFVQAVKSLNYRNQVWTLKFMLTQAQLNYAASITSRTVVTSWNTSVLSNDSSELIPQFAQYFHIAAITDFTSLVQFERMYDPTGVNNPTIQLGTFTATAIGTPTATGPVTVTLSSLPTVTWQGISL